MPIAIMIKKRNMLRMFLIGIKIGFVGISSCSFKKAIKLPVNVIVPIMILISIVVTYYSSYYYYFVRYNTRKT